MISLSNSAYNRLKTLFSILCIGAVVSACGSDGVANTGDTEIDCDGTLLEVINCEEDFQILTQAIARVDLQSALDDEDVARTVFAPTDQAFEALFDRLDVTAAGFLEREDLASILRYHLVNTEFNTDSLREIALQANNRLPNLQGETLEVQDANGELLVNGQSISAIDSRPSNGALYSIDEVLLQEQTLNLVDILGDDGRFSILMQAIEASIAIDFLTDNTGLTFFAPTDEAFEELFSADNGIDAVEDLLNLETLNDVLSYHAISREISVSGLETLSGSKIETLLSGTELGVSFSSDTLRLNQAELVESGLISSNGVIHVIDRVLVPSSTAFSSNDVDILDTLSSLTQQTNAPKINTFLAAVNKEDLEELLSGVDNYTLFVPTDEAFAAIGSLDEILGRDNLTQFILRHITEGELGSTDLYASNGFDGDSLVESAPLQISIDEDRNLSINGSVLVLSDIQTENGVVHIIDSVIESGVPATCEGSIDQVIFCDSTFDILNRAIVKTNLESSLQLEGTTLFAPTDEAFEALFDALKVTEEQFIERSDLASILSYHLVPEAIDSTTVTTRASSNDNLLTTIESSTIALNFSDGNLRINRSSPTELDIAVSNGALHGIDKVLIPPATFDFIDTIRADGRFSTLAEAVEQNGLVNDFSELAGLVGTFFAPTDAAFEELFSRSALIRSKQDLIAFSQIENILQYHVHETPLTQDRISTNTPGTLTTNLNDEEIGLSETGNQLLINQAQIEIPDVETISGQLQGIDRVLLPTVHSYGSDNLNIIQVLNQLNRDPDTPTFNNLLATLQAEGLDTELSRIIDTENEDPNIESEFDGQPPYTLFAPTDSAFESLGELDQILELDGLKNILKQHVLSSSIGDLRAAQLYANNGSSLQTMYSPKSNTISIDSSRNLTIDGTPLSINNVVTSNGTIHIIDSVIDPVGPGSCGGSIDVVIDCVAILDSFDALLESNETIFELLTDIELGNNGIPSSEVTVFAPSDQALDGLLNRLKVSQEEFLSRDDIDQFLGYHVFEQNLSTEDIAGLLSQGTNSVTSFSNESVTLSQQNTAIEFNQVAVVSADVATSNANLHIANGYLTPPEFFDIIETGLLDEDSRYTTFVDALSSSNNASNILSENQVSAFAPTDSAFTTLANRLNIDVNDFLNRDNIDDILAFHLSARTAINETLAQTASRTNAVITSETRDQAPLQLSLSEDTIFIENATVIEADITAKGGRIHLINKVLLPPLALNVEESIQYLNSDDSEEIAISIFTRLLTDTGRLDQLNNIDATVFIPSDQAFESLFEELSITEEEFFERDDLENFVNYHLLTGNLTESDLGNLALQENNFSQTFSEGLNLELASQGDDLLINNQVISFLNLNASNGQINQIDQVLKPVGIGLLSLTDTLQTEPSFGILYNLLMNSELSGVLTAFPEIASIFAPTNSAFQRLFEQLRVTQEEFQDRDDLEAILGFHLFSEQLLSETLSQDIANQNEIKTSINDQDITFSSNGSDLFVEESAIVTADLLAASNSADSPDVIHGIDKVVLIPSLLNSLERIQTDGDFDNFASLLDTENTDSSQTLSESLEITAFVPSDSAWNQLFAALGLTEEEFVATFDIEEILNFHLVNGIVDTSNLSNVLISLSDNRLLRVNDLDGEIRINDSLITEADLDTTNGILHTISEVLIPEGTFDITETIRTDDRFSILAEAIETVDSETLDNDLRLTNRTLFAPSDEAFNDLFESLNVSQQQFLQRGDLESILRYHLLERELRTLDAVEIARDTPNNISSSEGSEITFTVENDVLFINRAQVTDSDILASNGFLHEIDKVLIPPNTFNLLEAVQSDGRFTILAQAIEQADLGQIVDSISDATLFAPSDSAFEELISQNGDLNNVEDILALDNLVDILQYHLANSVLSGSTLDTIAGSTEQSVLENQVLAIFSQAQDLFVNEAFIFEEDISSSNGALHAIDRVLLPRADSSLSNTNLTTWGLISDLALNPSPEFTVLRTLLLEEGFDATLRGDGPFTVFAPTDAAFAQLGTLEVLLESAAVNGILRQHVISGSRLNSVELFSRAGTSIDTLQTSISTSIGALRTLEINGNTVTIKDIQTSNGVIHVIDTVITN